MRDLRYQMELKKATAVVLQALDEIACVSLFFRFFFRNYKNKL